MDKSKGFPGGIGERMGVSKVFMQVNLLIKPRQGIRRRCHGREKQFSIYWITGLLHGLELSAGK